MENKKMETTTSIINGVNTDRLIGTIEAVKEDPSLARFQFRAKSEWINGGHYKSTIQGFYGAGQEDMSRTEAFELHGDEPDVLLGEDHGPNPVEFVLHGLAGCLSTTFVYYAAANGVKIDAVNYTLEGELDLRGFLGISKEVRPGYQNIRVTFHVTSDAPMKKLEELCKLAQMRSPVFNTISEPVPVQVNMEKMNAGMNGY
jgi:uncharacterized OsmC-like protein